MSKTGDVQKKKKTKLLPLLIVVVREVVVAVVVAVVVVYLGALKMVRPGHSSPLYRRPRSKCIQSHLPRQLRESPKSPSLD